MEEELAFRFQSFDELIKEGRQKVSLSKLEQGFYDAADFDTDCALEGFIHPFIYRATRIPSVIWFFEFIGAAQCAAPIRATFLAFQKELGSPDSDGFGDEVWQVLESSPEWLAQFEGWAAAYKESSGWAALFERFLKTRQIDPKVFWSS